MVPSPTTPEMANEPDYEEEIDFQSLALQDPDFNKHYDQNKGKVDWQDPKAQQQLTKSLLKRDFSLSLELPNDRLCPPIPVRYNYVRWIQALLDTTTSGYDDTPSPSRHVSGLDIGVGASCIYPLLAVTTRSNWHMHGTDIDTKNFSYAQKNISTNALSASISLHFSTPEGPILPLSLLGVRTLDFTMSNPPFYASTSELLASSAAKALPPHAICTGAEVEMICPGGDAGFVLRMVDESVALGTKVQWYTSMFGKLGSMYEVLARLKQIGVTNWAVTSLRNTTATKRWALGWTFGDLRPRNVGCTPPPNFRPSRFALYPSYFAGSDDNDVDNELIREISQDIARHPSIPAALLPLPTAQTIHLSLPLTSSISLLTTTLSAIDLTWTWHEETISGTGSATSNSWSRSARRLQKRKRGSEDPSSARSSKLPKSRFGGEEDKEGISRVISSPAQSTEPSDVGKTQEEGANLKNEEAPELKKAEKEVALAFAIVLAEDSMEVRWLKGVDHVLFESFCGMLKRAMRPKAGAGEE